MKKQHSELKIKVCKIIVSICFVLICIIGLCLLFDVLFGEKKPVKQLLVPTQAEQQFSKHDAWIENQFSKFDGRHIKLTVLVKQKLNDPKSFEHVETKYSKQGDNLIVFMTYRATNSFGALVLGSVKAKVYYSNDVIEIL